MRRRSVFNSLMSPSAAERDRDIDRHGEIAKGHILNNPGFVTMVTSEQSMFLFTFFYSYHYDFVFKVYKEIHAQ